MSNARKVMQGRSVSSSTASQQFRGGDNSAINGYAASARAERADTEHLSSALHSAARAYERSGWHQEKLYQQEKKDMYMGKK
jgi:hypothetical protein